MKKTEITPQSKPAKMSKLSALLYSTAGIGLVTLVAQIAPLMDTPKNPRPLGE